MGGGCLPKSHPCRCTRYLQLLEVLQLLHLLQLLVAGGDDAQHLVPAGSGGAGGGAGPSSGPPWVQPNPPPPHPIHPPTLGICTESFPKGCPCPLGAESVSSALMGATIPIPASPPTPPHTSRTPYPTKVSMPAAAATRAASSTRALIVSRKCPFHVPTAHRDLLNPIGGHPPPAPSCPLSQGCGKAPAGTGQGWAPQPCRPPSQSRPNPSWEPAGAVGESPTSRARGGEVPKIPLPTVPAWGRKKINLGGESARCRFLNGGLGELDTQTMAVVVAAGKLV